MRNHFVSWTSRGKILFVGEGNFSFSLSLAENEKIKNANNFIATTLEAQYELDDFTKSNIRKLRLLGAKILTEINATKLDEIFQGKQFKAIVFQFPHVGSRDPLYNRNPNFTLLRQFLQSSVSVLARGGMVIVTAVDSPHYHGAFQFEEAALKTGFNQPTKYSFNPLTFPGYVHTMTNEKDNALENHEKFISLVFTLKQQ